MLFQLISDCENEISGIDMRLHHCQLHLHNNQYDQQSVRREIEGYEKRREIIVRRLHELQDKKILYDKEVKALIDLQFKEEQERFERESERIHELELLKAKERLYDKEIELEKLMKERDIRELENFKQSFEDKD